MKIGRIIFTICMALLCGFGWFSQLTARSGLQEQYETSLEAARDFEKRELYQRAIQSYEEVLALREEREVREELLDVYAKAYESESVTSSAYKRALEDACSRYPKDADLWVCLIELDLDSFNYQNAYKILERAQRAGASSEALDTLGIQIRYAYTESSRVFAQFCSTASGYTTVYDGSRWGVMAPDGDWAYGCDYSYISPYGDEGVILRCTEDSVRLYDAKGIVLAILDDQISQARAYGSGLLPVLREDGWQYLDCESGAFLPESYEEASVFQQGTAAVLRNKNWTLIDTSGGQILEQTFSSIKLHSNGNYCRDGLFIAGVGEGWDIYQTDGKRVSEISARDMDVFMGSYIAFQDSSGLWGFLNEEGEIVIEPRYQRARSFSGGLAAVFDGEYWGFINRSGETVIANQFLEVGYFTGQGICPVSTMDGQYHMLSLRFPEGR